MINIICALKHEARPIIDHFQLVHDGSSRSYTAYRNDKEGILLIITGTGKNAAALGTLYSIDYCRPDTSGIWLNIGIAGHKSLPIGTPVLADRITDYATGEIWQPHITFPTDLGTLPLLTVTEPSADYPDDDMIDMEASGFYSSACNIAPQDRIHCLKIISDNTLTSLRDINKRMIIDLISVNISTIENLILQLRTCSEKSATAGA